MIEVGVFDRFHSEAAAWLKGRGFHLTPLPPSAPAPPSEHRSIEAAVIRSRTKVDAAFFKKHPNLKLIVSMTAGFDHIDLDALSRTTIRAEHCPGAHTQAAAELTIGLAFASLRQIPHSHSLTLKGKGWQSDRSSLVGAEVRGRNWGVIGCGRIGRCVARIAQTLTGTEVYGYDPYLDSPDFEQLGIHRVGLEELFELCDIVSIHVPLTRQTRRMIHRGYLDRLRPQSLIINTSRGEVLNEVDLFEHFRAEKPGQFALDVFSEEPIPPQSSLAQNLELAVKQGRLIATPHIGALTEEAFRRVSIEAAQRVSQFFQTQRPSEPIALEDGQLPPNAAWFHSDYNL